MAKDDRIRAPFRMTPVVFHVLLTLADEDAHAYRIMKEVADRTDRTVSVGPGSLHFTLGKLSDAEMIVEAPERPSGEAEDARRKYYALTAFGRAVLEAELETLADIIELARTKKLIPGRA